MPNGRYAEEVVVGVMITALIMSVIFLLVIVNDLKEEVKIHKDTSNSFISYWAECEIELAAEREGVMANVYLR